MMPKTKPYELTKTPLGYIVKVYMEDGTSCEFNFKKFSESDEALKAFLEVRVYSSVLPEPLTPFLGYFNLTSQRSKKDLARYISNMSKLISHYDWDAIVEGVCQKVIKQYYTPEEPVRLNTIERKTPEFLLYPLLPKNHPTLWYAQGGSGKSLLALYIALLVQNGFALDPEHETPKTETLYLDWEVDEMEARRRLSMIIASLEHPEELSFPLYKRCVFTLKDELEAILNAIANYDIGFVIIDSAAPAIGGDINDMAKVIHFFNAIRKITALGVTVLILSHVSKRDKEAEEGKTPIGSVFFENLPRLTWELRYAMRENKMDIGLFPRKNNFGPLPSVGFRVFFDFGEIFFIRIDPSYLETSFPKTVKETILSVLAKNPQGLDINILAKTVSTSKQYVAKLLTELKRQGQVTNDEEGRWFICED